MERFAVATPVFNDRVPPHNLDAEMSALGSIMLSTAAMETVRNIITADDFYLGAHQEIFRAMERLQDGNRPVDSVTLKNELEAINQLEKVGGTDYLIALMESVVSPSNAGYYAQIVQEKATLRQLAEAGYRVSKLAFEQEGSVEETVDKAETEVFTVAQKRRSFEMRAVRELAGELFEEVTELLNTGEPKLGMMTGFSDLDALTTGFYPGDLVIVAARPAMGKTSLVLNFALSVARAQKGAVAVFSLEMTSQQLVQRMTATLAQVPSGVLRQHNLSEQDYNRLADACETLYTLPIYIDETSDINPIEMRTKLRRIQAQHGLSLVVVDYLQLMRGHRRTENRVQEIGDIARQLKSMAKQLGVPVVALSQLNRSVETRDDKRPQLSDLRESGSIEAEADMVMFIYRQAYYDMKNQQRAHDPHADPSRADVAELIVAKHRNGPTGRALLGFQPAYTRFTLLDSQSKEDYLSRRRDTGPGDDD